MSQEAAYIRYQSFVVQLCLTQQWNQLKVSDKSYT